MFVSQTGAWTTVDDSSRGDRYTYLSADDQNYSLTANDAVVRRNRSSGSSVEVGSTAPLPWVRQIVESGDRLAVGTVTGAVWLRKAGAWSKLESGGYFVPSQGVVAPDGTIWLGYYRTPAFGLIRPDGSYVTLNSTRIQLQHLTGQGVERPGGSQGQALRRQHKGPLGVPVVDAVVRIRGDEES